MFQFFKGKRRPLPRFGKVFGRSRVDNIDIANWSRHMKNDIGWIDRCSMSGARDHFTVVVHGFAFHLDR